MEIFIQVGKDYICIADDSGISINILAGFLGVHTARWMDVDDHTKNLELLKKVRTTPKEKKLVIIQLSLLLKVKTMRKHLNILYQAM